MIPVRVVRAGYRLMLMFSVLVLTAGAAAGAAAPVKGRLVHSLTGEPVAGATVILEGTSQRTESGSDGTFQLDSVAPGRYHVNVIAQGFSRRRTEIEVPASGTTIELKVDPELHFAEVVSVAAEPKNQFEAYQPTSVLAGQDLSRELGTTLGATLLQQPGMAERSFGAAPARPVIRGLDGDRVLILEDGQRMGDLSSQSGDHGVTVNPAAAEKIEVVRGPATLIYGSNAVGGLVNVISNAIPAGPVNGVKGGFTADLASNGGQGLGAADLWWGNTRWAMHATASGQHGGDYSTPEGKVENTQSQSAAVSVGAAWTGDHGYVGGNYAYEDTRYGLPYVEEGQTQLTPRRQMANLRSEWRDMSGPLSSVRLSFASRRYRHEEISAGEIATNFKNDTNEFEFLANHRAVGRLRGTVGAWALDRAFSATGEEALSPPVDQRGLAAFLFEELTWDHVTFQLGGRFDRATYTPQDTTLQARTFNNYSGSLGLVLRPPVADHRLSVALSLAKTARYPALEELYFHGPHPGNFAYEIGNPDLEHEHALGFDASLRWRANRVSSELTFFRNAIENYILRNPVLADDGSAVIEDEFPVIEFVAADSVLQGVEWHVDVQLASRLFADGGIDYVRGTIEATGDPLPRIPPFRARGGLRYQVSAFNVGAEVTGVSSQDRIFATETPTDGYSTLKLFSSYSRQIGRSLSTITVRLDNATNELYRNHLSYVKDFVAEKGRTFKVVYSVKF